MYSLAVTEVAKINVEDIITKAQQRLASIVPRALDVVHELLENSPDDRVRLAAAKDILDRAGMSPRIKVDGEFTITVDDEIERLIERLKRPAPVIDIDAIEDDVLDDDDVDESPTRRVETAIYTPGEAAALLQ